MTGRAGALAAAISVDARYAIINGAPHNREAEGHLYLMLGAVGFDIGDLRHFALSGSALVNSAARYSSQIGKAGVPAFTMTRSFNSTNALSIADRACCG